MVNLIRLIGISILLVTTVLIFGACLLDVTESVQEFYWKSFSKEDIKKIIEKENE